MVQTGEALSVYIIGKVSASESKPLKSQRLFCFKSRMKLPDKVYMGVD